jgi:O-antigen/teichoic acid export membrane protein
VGRNTLALLVTINSTYLLSFFVTLLVTRALGAETYGQYALLVNWVAILGSFSDLGFNTLTVRDVAKHKDRTAFYLTHVMVMRFVFSAAFYLVLVLLGFLLRYEPLLLAGLAVMGGRLVVDATSGVYAYLLQAHERMGRQGTLMLGGTALRLAGVAWVLARGGGLLAVCWVWVAASVATLLAMALDAASRGWTPRFGDFRTVRAAGLLKAAVPFALVGALQMAYSRFDSVLLKSLAGNAQVGYYGASAALLSYVQQMAHLFALALLPVMSATLRAADFMRVFLRSVKAVLFAAFPVSVGGALLAGPIVRLLFGESFAASAPVLSVLLLSVVPFYLTVLVMNVLAVRRPGALVLLYLVLLAVNVAMNVLWIPARGPEGCAWARVASDMAGWVLGFLLVRPFLSSVPVRLVWPIGASLLSALAMGACIRLDPRLYWLAAGPALYFLLLWALRAIGPEDWSSLRSVLGRRGG